MTKIFFGPKLSSLQKKTKNMEGVAKLLISSVILGLFCLFTIFGKKTVALSRSVGNIAGVDYLTSCTSRKCGRCDRRRSPARVAATAGLVAGQCPINEDSLTWLPRTSSPIQSSSTYHHHHQPQDAQLSMR